MTQKTKSQRSRRRKDVDLGWTRRYVTTLLGRRDLTFGQFLEWHRGQTAAIDSTGQVRYYRHDVERFLRKGPKARVLD